VIPVAAKPMSQMFQRFTIKMFDLKVKQKKPLKILERYQPWLTNGYNSSTYTRYSERGYQFPDSTPETFTTFTVRQTKS
jgi:hypothetical protein